MCEQDSHHWLGDWKDENDFSQALALVDRIGWDEISDWVRGGSLTDEEKQKHALWLEKSLNKQDFNLHGIMNYLGGETHSEVNKQVMEVLNVVFDLIQPPLKESKRRHTYVRSGALRVAAMQAIGDSWNILRETMPNFRWIMWALGAYERTEQYQDGLPDLDTVTEGISEAQLVTLLETVKDQDQFKSRVRLFEFIVPQTDGIIVHEMEILSADGKQVLAKVGFQAVEGKIDEPTGNFSRDRRSVKQSKLGSIRGELVKHADTWHVLVGSDDSETLIKQIDHYDPTGDEVNRVQVALSRSILWSVIRKALFADRFWGLFGDYSISSMLFDKDSRDKLHAYAHDFGEDAADPTVYSEVALNLAIIALLDYRAIEWLQSIGFSAMTEGVPRPVNALAPGELLHDWNDIYPPSKEELLGRFGLMQPLGTRLRG